MTALDLPKTLSEAQREITRLRASLSAPTTPDTKTVERVAAAMWSVNGFDFSYEEAKKDAAAGEKGHIRAIEWAYDMACAAIAAMPDTTAQADTIKALTEASELVEYVLQDDLHNRLTPRVVDIAYNAFLQATRPNPEDGGKSDWFTDTRPMVMAKIKEIRKDLAAAKEPT